MTSSRIAGRMLAAAVSTLIAVSSGAALAAPAANGKAGKFDVYADALRTGQFDVFSEGARQGRFDVFSEGARKGQFDVFSEGARQGRFDPYSEGASKGGFNPFTDGAHGDLAASALDNARGGDGSLYGYRV
ncbi:hypothetical protein [Cupriavidus sp. AU9028]|uniref:hypothetical protein n=1 Tax=Cupriavidus sp. AU9028 TaxID=2871157 RepID=UPI00351CBFE5